jgi:hypothetical protein
LYLCTLTPPDQQGIMPLVREGLVEGRPLCLAPIALKAFMRLQVTALSGLRRTLGLLRAQISKTFMAVVRVSHVVGTAERGTEKSGYCSAEQNIVIMRHRVLQGTWLTAARHLSWQMGSRL